MRPKKMSKQEEIDKMAKDQFQMMRNPFTNTVNQKEINTIAKNIADGQYRTAQALDWEERGPDNFGGRTRAIAFDPKDASGNTIWAGGIAGGLWKCTNAFSDNYEWESIEAYQGNVAISKIVFDPSDADIIYIGTGEGWFNADAFVGDGIYRSLDGGKSFSKLSSTDDFTFRYIQDIVVLDDRLFACTRDGGVQMSFDRGETWVKSLGNGQFGFSDRSTSIDVGADGTLIASMGFGGSQDGLYKSVDKGETWEYLELPGGGARRIEMAIAPSNPKVMYALKENPGTNGVEEILKTENGGISWEILIAPKYIENNGNFGNRSFARGQAWYDLFITIDPTNENRIFIGGVDVYLSEDGGDSWDIISHWFGGHGLQFVHADQHAIDYLDDAGDKLVLSNDGGVYLIENAKNSLPTIQWKNFGYNTIQFYACALHPTDENWFLGGTQDNGSHLFRTEGINSTDRVTGGDGAYCHIDRDNPNIQISSFQNHGYNVTLDAWNSRDFYGMPPHTEAFFINPTDYDDVFDRLLVSTNPGEIHILNVQTGGLDSLNISGLADARVSAIKAHPTDPTKIYIGSEIGKVVRIDSLFQGSPSFTTLTQVSGFVRNIDVDLNDPNKLLFTVSNQNLPSIFVSNDDGATWIDQSGDLPGMPKRWAMFNPLNSESIIFGTELGIWTTNALLGDDTQWTFNSSNMPVTRVDMIDIRPSDNTILAATHGRGMYTAKLCTAAMDNDGDGFSCDEDCNDFDAQVNLDAQEIPYNGIDDDCNPDTPDDDIDGDGFALAFDCDDTNALINPDAQEILNNGIDEDCDGSDTEDDCNSFQNGPWNVIISAGDCMNGPAETEWQIWSNEAYVIGDMVDGIKYYFDFCQGFDSSVFMPSVNVYRYNSANDELGPAIGSSTDCRTEFLYNEDSSYPEVIVIIYDLEDCNGSSITSGNGALNFGCLSSGIDIDGDGFTDEIDCDDNDPGVNPGAEEIYYNGIDDDCSGETVDDDQDGDGWSLADDCDDENPDISPDQIEIFFNGIDDDCNPETLDNDLDGDGYGLDEDCDETNPDINPGAFDIPGNGIDENCDGVDGVSSTQDLDGYVVNIFPNPTTGVVNIKSSADIQFVCEVYTQQGRLVKTVRNKKKFDLAQFTNGTYIIKLRNVRTGNFVVEQILLIK